MKNSNNRNVTHQHPVDPNEIWGMNFFWAKDLKIEEEDIRKVSENFSHADKEKIVRDHLKKPTE